MRLLIHICCGPCVLYPIRQLSSSKFKDVVGFYYNPNIHPPSEYKKRKDAVQEIGEKMGFQIIESSYKMEEFFRKIFSNEDHPDSPSRRTTGEARRGACTPSRGNSEAMQQRGASRKRHRRGTHANSVWTSSERSEVTCRCRLCWELRLSKTADFAKEKGFDAFTTTLLISPYQDHAFIKEIGKKIAKERGLEFWYEDFRKGFKESQKEAKEREIYRQKYCGCVFSELERININ